MANSIPASQIVSVNPGVISAGGSQLDMIGLLLTQNTRIPIGTVATFTDAASVATYFGSGTTEALAAASYFLGYDNSSVKPAALKMAQYPYAAVAGYVRGGSGITLAQVQAITSGTLTIIADGVSKTSSALNMSAAASLSAAATTITAAFTAPGFAMTYDSVSGAFVVTSSTTGVASTVSITTGSVATALLLTTATGAVTSPGSNAAAPGAFMDGIVATTQDFVSITTTWETSSNDGLAFAAWVNGKNSRYRFVLYDTDGAVITASDTTSVGYLIKTAGYSGTVLVYAPVNTYLAAAFWLSIPACNDYEALNGRATTAFKSQAGLSPDVTNATYMTNLIANGYNSYGAYGTANDLFVFAYPGSITGKFLWDDSYVDQVWLNNALQLAGMTLLTSVKSIPYNAQGRALIAAAMSDPIKAAVNYGAIRSGVALSALQVAEINAAAGVDAATTVQNRGWYLQVSAASAIVRAARGSPPVTLWYSDGQSVQKIALNSLEVQ